MDVAATAGTVRPRLRHERCVVPRALDKLLDRIPEGKSLVGAGQAERRPVVDLELRRRVLAVVCDHIDSHRLNVVEQLVDEGRPLVAHVVEDEQASKQGLHRLGLEHVELELVGHHGPVSHLVRLLEHPAQDMARRRPQGFTRSPLRVADHFDRSLVPGNGGHGLEVGVEQLVAKLHLLVVVRARHHARAGVQGQRASIKVEALPGKSGDVLNRHHLAA